MRKKPGTKQSQGEKVVKDIRRAMRKQYSAEEKIGIVLDGRARSRADGVQVAPSRNAFFADSDIFSVHVRLKPDT